jgi:uncharacterized protein YndB with AHSA1/START domain
MMSATDRPTAHSAYALEILRTLDAPPKLGFEAWSCPEHARRWWYPRKNGRGVSIFLGGLTTAQARSAPSFT